MKVNKKRKKQVSDVVFYVTMLAWPVLQFCVFYIAVNINSVLLAFENIDAVTGKVDIVGFDNFKKLFYDIQHLPEFKYAIKNSLTFFLIALCISTPTGLIFSYYIFKSYFCGKFFQTILFLPSIICSMVTVIMYRYFVEFSVPEVINKVFGTHLSLLFTENKLKSVYVYNLTMGFGVSILLYLGAMNSISSDVLEAAKLDGVNHFQEFVHIIFPQIFSTFSVFFVSSVAAIFTNQMNLFTFFDKNVDPMDYSMGYYLYKNVLYGGETKYPYLAALGLVITAIIAPITILIRKLFFRIDPMREEA